MHENLAPDVSIGTHFLNELVETDMLYKAGKWVDAVKVVDACEAADGTGNIFLGADAFKQKVVCYFVRA